MLAVEARENRNAISAALLMHGLLAAALLFSLQWNKRTPPVQAELWSGMPRDLPATVVPPTPVAKPAPPAPPPPAPEVKADISLQKKKEEPKKAEPKKAEPPKQDLVKERERQEALKKAADKKLAEQRAAEQIQAQRKAELARLLGTDPNAKPGAQGKDAATKTGVVTGGAAVGAKTGETADYTARIGAKIRSHIRFNPAGIPGNPRVDFVIEQLPDGTITKVSRVKSSENPAWDAAVEKAIWAAAPLPKPKEGPVARTLDYSANLNEIR